MFTHEHSDHFDDELLKTLLAAHRVPVYAGQSVASLTDAAVNVVTDSQEWEVAGFKIKAFGIKHFDFGRPGMVVPNLGYLIDGHLLHPGDSWEWPKVTSPQGALPLYPGFELAVLENAIKPVGASQILLIHYTPEGFPDPDVVKRQLRGVTVVVLADGATTVL